MVIDELLDDEKEVLDNAYISRNEFLYSGPQNLYDDFFPRKSRPMNLPE